MPSIALNTRKILESKLPRYVVHQQPPYIFNTSTCVSLRWLLVLFTACPPRTICWRRRAPARSTIRSLDVSPINTPDLHADLRVNMEYLRYTGPGCAAIYCQVAAKRGRGMTIFDKTVQYSRVVYMTRRFYAVSSACLAGAIILCHTYRVNLFYVRPVVHSPR